MRTRLYCPHCGVSYYAHGTVIRGGYTYMVVTNGLREHDCFNRKKKKRLQKVKRY